MAPRSTLPLVSSYYMDNSIPDREEIRKRLCKVLVDKGVLFALSMVKGHGGRVNLDTKPTLKESIKLLFLANIDPKLKGLVIETVDEYYLHHSFAEKDIQSAIDKLKE